MIPGTVDSSMLLELTDRWLKSAERIEHALAGDPYASAAVLPGVQSVRACAEELKKVVALGRLP
jgi:hypothetical protein